MLFHTLIIMYFLYYGSEHLDSESNWKNYGLTEGLKIKKSRQNVEKAFFKKNSVLIFLILNV